MNPQAIETNQPPHQPTDSLQVATTSLREGERNYSSLGAGVRIKFAFNSTVLLAIGHTRAITECIGVKFV